VVPIIAGHAAIEVITPRTIFQNLSLVCSNNNMQLAKSLSSLRLWLVFCDVKFEGESRAESGG